MSASDPVQLFTADHLDYAGMARRVWLNRKKILLATLAGFFVGVVYAFFLAKPVFKSTVLLIPTEPPKLDQLGAASALLGKKGGAENSDAMLYQGLLTSRTVMHRLLVSKIANFTDTGAGRVEDLRTFLGVDTSELLQVEKFTNSMQKQISVVPGVEGAGGIVEVAVLAAYPWLAQQLARNLLDIGQAEIREVRLDRSNTVIPRLRAAVDSARKEWDSAAVLYANFIAGNRSALLPSQVLQTERLLMDKNAKEQKYLLARRELETRNLEHAKSTSPMVILDPANLPARKAKPKRIVLVIAFSFLAFFGSTAFFLVRDPLAMLLGQLKRE